MRLSKLAVPPTRRQKRSNIKEALEMASNRGGQGGSSERGFAGMDDKKQREIASQGGKASARQQNRGPNGQFTGLSGGSSNSGSSSRSSSSGNRSGGSNR